MQILGKLNRHLKKLKTKSLHLIVFSTKQKGTHDKSSALNFMYKTLKYYVMLKLACVAGWISKVVKLGGQRKVIFNTVFWHRNTVDTRK